MPFCSLNVLQMNAKAVVLGLKAYLCYTFVTTGLIFAIWLIQTSSLIAATICITFQKFLNVGTLRKFKLLS